MIPSPVLNNIDSTNKHISQYLVIDGHLTRLGYKFLKMMNVYWKSNRSVK